MSPSAAITHPNVWPCCDLGGPRPSKPNQFMCRLNYKIALWVSERARKNGSQRRCYPRDSMLARVFATATCLSVCHHVQLHCIWPATCKRGPDLISRRNGRVTAITKTNFSGMWNHVSRATTWTRVRGKFGENRSKESSTPCPEKNGPPKHVKITLWIENESQYFSLYHEKPSICKVCVKFHDN